MYYIWYCSSSEELVLGLELELGLVCRYQVFLEERIKREDKTERRSSYNREGRNSLRSLFMPPLSAL